MESSSPENSRKRQRPVEELEINIDGEVPLSKRAARRLKKGRSLNQAPSSQKPLPAEFDDASSDDNNKESDNDAEAGDAQPTGKSHKKLKRIDRKTKKTTTTTNQGDDDDEQRDEPKKGTNGIWIGNLNFRTTETDLITFFTTLKPLGKPASAQQSYSSITASDMTRISLPISGDKRGQNKGFAYIDFKLPEHQITAVALSERILNSRNVLIKAADSFDGRPAANKDSIANNNHNEINDQKATKILYIGNLSFDITSEDLEEYLGGKEAGIRKVRMATFEDSGKCKGFAFIDFETPEQVKKILLDRRLANMNGRKLKMEFGQDRSMRRPGGGAREPRENGDEKQPPRKVDPRSVPPGRALMTAQRASHAIVAGQGKKQTFE